MEDRVKKLFINKNFITKVYCLFYANPPLPILLAEHLLRFLPPNPKIIGPNIGAISKAVCPTVDPIFFITSPNLDPPLRLRIVQHLVNLLPRLAIDIECAFYA